MFSTTPQPSLTTTIPEHMFTAFVLDGSLKKEPRELPAIHAQMASIEVTFSGKIYHPSFG
jgi:hypothetical protein